MPAQAGELGRVLIRSCTQLVFLTATAAPGRSRVFQVMQIPAEEVHMFQSATTRRNVQYQVREPGQDSEIEVVC
jgi:phosphopantothenoylcysteine synthetase/decarboxylase